MVAFGITSSCRVAANQLKNFLGLKIPNSNEFLETLDKTFSHIGETNLAAISLGIFTVLFILIMKKVSKKFPAPLVAMILSAIFVVFFDLSSYSIKLIGDIPRTLPPISSFPLNMENFRALLAPALAIAILGLVEALSIAKSLASKVGDKVDGNQEFIAQGISNLSASISSSIPGNGSFTRSAVNFGANAATRFAGIFSGRARRVGAAVPQTLDPSVS